MRADDAAASPRAERAGAERSARGSSLGFMRPDRAWSYPHPYPSGIQRVGKDFSDYVAFWKEIRVVE